MELCSDMKFKWFWSVNCFQAKWALAQLFKGERSLFEKCIQENFVYKEPRSLKAKSKAKKIKFWTFVWTCYTWSKCNMEDAIVFYDTA